MTTFQILSLLGIGSLSASFIIYLVTIARGTTKRVKALCLGVQAVLRAQMIDMYNKYSEMGYAPIYAKQNFENCWINYEALGANGVMSNIRTQFMNLPDNKNSNMRNHEVF